MKVCGQMMEVTLTVYGRERTFSEQELIAILEKHFSNEATEQVSTAKLAQVPTEGKWFEVNPQAIDQTLFQEKRENLKQEKARKLILKAFAEVKSNPEQYGKKFKTMMPKKYWLRKSIEELKCMACRLGDHNADCVEQALEWAQRIHNGESWEDICNNADTANWYRLVLWKDGSIRFVGGSRFVSDTSSASDVSGWGEVCKYGTCFAVPLVVLYEK